MSVALHYDSCNNCITTVVV